MLSVVIPAYNEEEVIVSTIFKVVQVLSAASIPFELIVVDNNSTDETFSLVTNISNQDARVRIIPSPPQPGYGVAVKAGLEYVKGSQVCVYMADAADPPIHIVEMYQAMMEGYEGAFGTRFLEGVRVKNYPLFKLMLNRLGNNALALVLGFKYDDFTNGFKMYDTSILKKIKSLDSDGFSLTIEMVIKYLKLTKNIKVIKTSWEERDLGTSKFHVFKEITQYLGVIVRTVFS